MLGLEKKKIMKGKVKIHANPTKHRGYEKRRSSTGAVFRSAVPSSALGLKVSGRNRNLATGQLNFGLGY